MAPQSTNPQLLRRVEIAIKLASPLLDLVIAVGDRVSRVLDRDDGDYVPARMTGVGESAPRGLRRRGPGG